MNEQELNKKLAEWAGVPLMAVDFGFPSSDVMYEPPNFTQSLDACFKWLVPNHDITSIMFLYTDDEVICKVEVAWSKEYEGIANIGKEALALCLAIEKLINKEKENE